MTANATEKISTNDLISKQKEFIWQCAATYYEHPLALERGEGMHVWDTEGNQYLDCFGGVLTTSVGHARPEVVKAVSEQIGRIAHTSTLYINQQQIELAEKVQQITPGNLKKANYESNPIDDGTLKGFKVIQVPLTTLNRNALADLPGLGNKEKDRCKNFFALGLTGTSTTAGAGRLWSMATTPRSAAPTAT